MSALQKFYHSLWMGWTLLGLGFISFTHIGVATRQRKWLVEAGVYLAMLILLFAGTTNHVDSGPETPFENFAVTTFIIGWLVSMVRAFLVRREYILRREALALRGDTPDRELQARVQREYGVNVEHPPSHSHRPFGQALTLASSPRSRHWEKGESFPIFQRMLTVHELAAGQALDATEENPDLVDALDELERQGLVEIDVAHARYKLTAEGEKLHEAWLQQGRDLVRRYDRFADVNLEAPPGARFRTGLGRDLRVPMYELDEIDPFKARLLVGLADKEWHELARAWACLGSKDWWAGIFEVVERAPTIAELGRERLAGIKAEAASRRKSTVRAD